MQSRLFFTKSGRGRPRNPVTFVSYESKTTFHANYGSKRRPGVEGRANSPTQLSSVAEPLRVRQWQHLPLLPRIIQMRTLALALEGKELPPDEISEDNLPTEPRKDGVEELVLHGEKSRKEPGAYRSRRRSVALKDTYLSRKRRKSLRPSPPSTLAAWLDSKPIIDRSLLKIFAPLDATWSSSLPTILLRYLHELQNYESQLDALSATLDDVSIRTLQRSGLTPLDLQHWAFIVSAPTDEMSAQRYLSHQFMKPTFLLLEILRRNKLTVQTFRKLLIQTWDSLFGVPFTRPTLRLLDIAEGEQSEDRLALMPSLALDLVRNSGLLEDTTFTVLISRLLRCARQLWAPAIISISHLIVQYCERMAGDKGDGTNLLPSQHAKLSKIYNMMLRRLSLPASANPLKAMDYNWKAQRVLLESAGKFRPPLTIDRASYSAVARVLGASMKSPSEVKYISLIRRPWPPWREELHGMDVERSPDEDISRVIAVISRMREAGYGEEASDKALRILGGRESDGTPTIQTRILSRARRKRKRAEPGLLEGQIPDETEVWAARIRATRDVQEAWMAFAHYPSASRRPSLAMYHAMFEKLIYQSARDGRTHDHKALPGDGKEVMPIINDNMTESEKLRIQPPTIAALYSKMIRDGIRPSGQCLNMLVSKASSIRVAIRYLQDSTIAPTVVKNLLGHPKQFRRPLLTQIPEETLTAFIKFLSRSPTLYSSDRTQKPPKGVQANPSDRLNSLVHAFELLKRCQFSTRPAWYALFATLAKTGLVLDQKQSQDLNDILSWQLLEAAIRDGKKAGLQLDPLGLQLMCRALEKALLASPHVSREEAAPTEGGQKLVKELFASMTEFGEAEYGLPRLLYGIGGPHLHAYIRVLGILGDADEAVAVLRFIVEHQDELQQTAKTASNGRKMLRRLLIATRSFFDGYGVDERQVECMRELVEKLDGWGGWPTDEEVETYRAKSMNGTDQVDKED